LIIKRYEAGETLASIARTYDCSPPAISYIVSRSRAREAPAEGAPQLPELIVVNTQPSETPGSEASSLGRPLDELPVSSVRPETTEPVAPLPVQPQPTKDAQPSIPGVRGPDLGPELLSTNGNGVSNRLSQMLPDRAGPGSEPSGGLGRTNASQNIGQRRTLHLQLSQDGAPHSESEVRDIPAHSSNIDDRFAAAPARVPRPSPVEPQTRDRPPYGPATNGDPYRRVAEPHPTRDVGAFIDQALRERVDGDITAFLAAFDAALAQDTPENRAGLREATDRLLRAGARTRIELERLEARVPLPPRDAARHAPPAWRPR